MHQLILKKIQVETTRSAARNPKQVRLLIGAILFLVVIGFYIPPTITQESTSIVLSVGIPSDIIGSFNRSIFAEFENQHPGVYVVAVPMDFSITADASSQAELYFEQLEDVASSADLLYLSSYILSPEASQSGYFLDLSPLMRLEDNSDFYPAAWNGYSWNNGIWAIPSNFGLYALNYSPSLFDEAGLDYPNANWTLDDLAYTAQALTLYDTNDQIVRDGLQISSGAELWLLRSLLGENLVAINVIPEQPLLNSARSQELLLEWIEFKSQNIFSSNLGSVNNEAAMTITSVLSEIFAPDRQNALLPGGKAGLALNGFAVSAGTSQIELAYQLGLFLSSQEAFLASYGTSVLPARQSLAETYLQRLPAETQLWIQEALANAISPADIRYTNYYLQAGDSVIAGESDAAEALDNAQVSALTAQQNAITASSQVSISVISPTAPPVIVADELSLRFGFTSAVQPLPNQSNWDSVIEEFVSTDSAVSNIQMEVISNRADQSEAYDCFYLPYTPDVTNTTQILDISPLMQADPNFNPGDFLSGTLEMLTRNHKIMGYPVTIRFLVLTYRESLIQNFSIVPENGWGWSQFVTNLEEINAFSSPALGTNEGIPTHLLLLIAANGGLPIDYRSSPPTLQFTDPDTMISIRTVLDLSREGYLAYRPQPVAGSEPQGLSFSPMMTGILNDFQFASMEEDAEKYVFYPLGEQYTPISMGVGALYISTQSQSPEACYRWFKTMMRYPTLFGDAIPATYSAIESPETLSQQGQEQVETYRWMAQTLSNPNTVLFPSDLVGWGAIETIPIENWLYRAFDAYVVTGLPLDESLSAAQEKAERYLACIASLEPAIEAVNYNELVQPYNDCARQTDPDLFGGDADHEDDHDH